MVVEKALAREYEGYDNLEGGAIDYALMIITGNPAFRFNLLNENVQMLVADGSLWRKIRDYSDKQFLLGAGTLPKNEMPVSLDSLEGCHAYGILDAFEFDGNKLLKIKDPWGLTHWNGEWFQGSPKWTNRMKEYVALRKGQRKERRRQNHAREDEENKTLIQTQTLPQFRQSSFYMSWEDFVKFFEVVFVSMRFGPEWECKVIRDNWSEGRAGGSGQNLQTVRNNPQYLIEANSTVEIYCLLSQLIPPAQFNVPKVGFGIYKYEEGVLGESGVMPELVALGRYSEERAILL